MGAFPLGNTYLAVLGLLFGFWGTLKGECQENQAYFVMATRDSICMLPSYTHDKMFCPVGWGCRIHRLHLCKEVTSPNNYPDNNTKQYDSEVPVMLELWGMWSTPSLPSLPGSLWPVVVAPDKVLFMGQLELNCVFMLN